MKKLISIYRKEKDKKKKDEIHLLLLTILGLSIIIFSKYYFQTLKADFALLVSSSLTVILIVAFPKYLILIKNSISELKEIEDIFNIGIFFLFLFSLVNIFFIVDMENITGSNIKLPTAVVISIISLIRFLYYKKKNK